MWKSCCARLTLILNHIIEVFVVFYLLHFVYFAVFIEPRLLDSLGCCMPWIIADSSALALYCGECAACVEHSVYSVATINISIIAYCVCNLWYLAMFWNCTIDINPINLQQCAPSTGESGPANLVYNACQAFGCASTPNGTASIATCHEMFVPNEWKSGQPLYSSSSLPSSNGASVWVKNVANVNAAARSNELDDLFSLHIRNSECDRAADSDGHQQQNHRKKKTNRELARKKHEAFPTRLLSSNLLSK